MDQLKTSYAGRFAAVWMTILLAVACTSPAPQPVQEPPQPTPDRTSASPATAAPPASSPTPAAPKQPAPAISNSAPAKKSDTPAKTPAPAVRKPAPDRSEKPVAPVAPVTAPPPPVAAPPAVPEPTKTACGADLPPKDFSRQDVYKGRPFQPGESANYEVSYVGVHAGYGNIDVEQPIRHDGVWHQVFSGNASTGDWYEKIFIVKDKIRAVSRPWDFGAAQFYIEQDEGLFFGRRFTQKKWITFDQNNCKVFEKTENRKKEIKNDEYQLEPGADDALSAFFALRTLNFKPGRTERIQVYTSEKNWFLDAEPITEESVQVPAGTFKAMKLKLTTYLGKDLQQKGDVFIWIATEHPNRPMIRVEAEVKVGSIQVRLKNFVPGR